MTAEEVPANQNDMADVHRDTVRRYSPKSTDQVQHPDTVGIDYWHHLLRHKSIVLWNHEIWSKFSSPEEEKGGELSLEVFRCKDKEADAVKGGLAPDLLAFPRWGRYWLSVVSMMEIVKAK